MTTPQQPIVHREELDLAYLIGTVPEQELGDYDALFHAAVRDELQQAGHDPNAVAIGEMRFVREDEIGCHYLVDVTVGAEQQVIILTALGEELAAISTFRERILRFAEQAMRRLAAPGQRAVVGDCVPPAPDRVGLWIGDTETDEALWHAQPLATPIAVLAAIDEEVNRRYLATSGL